MRIEPIKYTMFNYAQRGNMVQQNQGASQGNKALMLMNATSCSSKAEAVELSKKHPGQLFSWNGIIFRNGKQVG